MKKRRKKKKKKQNRGRLQPGPRLTLCSSGAALASSRQLLRSNRTTCCRDQRFVSPLSPRPSATFASERYSSFTRRLLTAQMRRLLPMRAFYVEQGRAVTRDSETRRATVCRLLAGVTVTCRRPEAHGAACVATFAFVVWPALWSLIMLFAVCVLCSSVGAGWEGGLCPHAAIS